MVSEPRIYNDSNMLKLIINTKIMKKIKYVLSISLILVLFQNCTEDNNDLSYVVDAPAPSNLSLIFDVTADNTGLVTITPNGEGSQSYDISYGDDSNEAVTLSPGESTEHIYNEGVYNVLLTATSLNGLTTEYSESLTVSYQAPQNLQVSIENDGAVSRVVRVTATADFGISYEVDFGEDGESSVVSANIGDEIVYEYEDAGFYDISVTAFSAAIATTQYVEENFEVTELQAPSIPAPFPQQPSFNVISIYSDAYTPTTVSELPTEWSGSGFNEIQVEGDNIIQYFDLDFTGIVTDYGNPTDLTGMDFVHFDYWSNDVEDFGIKIVNTNLGEEDIETVGTTTQGEWVSVDIPLDDFNMDRSAVSQILFDNIPSGTITVFIDNLYFYDDVPLAPVEAAPVPTSNAANVISIYSDSYTQTTVTELPTVWSGSGFEEIQIEGNNTIKYFDLDFTGIVTDYGNPADLSEMTHVHFDYWTPDGQGLGIKLVNTNIGQQDQENVGTVSRGQWISVDIPLNDFAINRSAVSQILFDNIPPGTITVFIDNLYFYN